MLFPTLATDGQGTFIFAWGGNSGLSGTGSDTDIVFRRSTDSGLTWESLKILNPNATTDSGGDGNPYIASDGNNTWVCMWESTENIGGAGTGDLDIIFSRSTDDGTTWSTPALVNTTYGVSGSKTDNRVRLANDGAGNWVAVWQSLENTATFGTDIDIFYSTSSDNGATWSAEAALNSNAPGGGISDNNSGPLVTFDGTSTWVTVWTSEDDLGSTVGGDADIFYATSVDDGATWSNLATLNANAAGDIGGDSAYGIAADSAGNLTVVWEQSAADPHIGVARSTNAGATWSSTTSLDGPIANSLENYPAVGSTGNDDWIIAWSSQPQGGGAYGSDADIFFVLDGNPVVVDISLSGTTPTNSQTVDFDVVFSEAVSGVNEGDFSPSITGLTGASIDSVSPITASSYVVTVDTGTGDGTVALSVADDDTIVDGFSNALGGAGAGNGDFGPSAAYTIDRVGPTIDITGPSATVTSTGPVTYTVTYGGATGITLAPGNVTLDATSTASATVGISGSGLTTRTITLSSIVGDGTLGITIAAGTATDGAANGAPGVGPSATFIVDNTAPNVTVEPLYTLSTSPKLEGAIDDPAAAVVVTIGAESHPAVNFGGGWEVAAGTFAALSPGVHTVSATATDAAGNIGMDANPLTIFSTGSGGSISSNIGLGLIQEGALLQLTAPAGSTGHLWFKDGELMVDDAPRLTGVDEAMLVFDTVLVSDSGQYAVVYDDGSKTTVVSQTLILTVLPAGSLPLGKGALFSLVVIVLCVACLRRYIVLKPAAKH